MTYDEFLKTKENRAEACGFEVDRNSITKYAFDYQKDIKAVETEMHQASLFDMGETT